jgi:hypothetical protein
MVAEPGSMPGEQGPGRAAATRARSIQLMADPVQGLQVKAPMAISTA